MMMMTMRMMTTGELVYDVRGYCPCTVLYTFMQRRRSLVTDELLINMPTRAAWLLLVLGCAHVGALTDAILGTATRAGRAAGAIIAKKVRHLPSLVLVGCRLSLTGRVCRLEPR